MTYGLGPAGYDVRIAEEIVIPRGGARLASTLEHFDMPNDLLARVADKSTWARRFVAVQNTIIEPGWRGYLTLEISNHSDSHVRIVEGSPIAQIIFDLLDEPAERPYDGKYQDQPRGAVAAIHEEA
jgi:dCTP deaminase